ncbi:MAG: substrate-binding domain-containing protein [Planctomycetota bacterium]
MPPTGRAVGGAMKRSEIFAEAFPPRAAVEALRERVVAYLKERQPAPGSKFMTDADLAEQSGLSRSTIRRALEPLQRDGWLSREAGRGTFVGPRAHASLRGTETPTATRTVRLGVLLFDIGALNRDWITPQVMAGIDRAADRADVTIELLGMREVDIDSLSRRLERSRPDVLASLASQPRDAMLLREAVRLGIKTLVVGTAHQYLGLPTVAEDNRQGMNLVLDAVRDAGHERVGLVINRWPGGWVFERQEAFDQHLRNHGLDPHEIGTCWIGSSDWPAHEARRIAAGHHPSDEPGPAQHALQDVRDWMRRTRPTALVAGSYTALETICASADQLGWSIPGDLSVVALDRHPLSADWLHGVDLTLAELPLRAMGERVAWTARALADGVKVEQTVRVPFEFCRGASLGPPA